MYYSGTLAAPNYTFVTWNPDCFAQPLHNLEFSLAWVQFGESRQECFLISLKRTITILGSKNGFLRWIFFELLNADFGSSIVLKLIGIFGPYGYVVACLRPGVVACLRNNSGYVVASLRPSVVASLRKDFYEYVAACLRLRVAACLRKLVDSVVAWLRYRVVACLRNTNSISVNWRGSLTPSS